MKKHINNPYDYAFGILYTEFPKELHELLNIPGKFKRKSNVKVRLKNGKVLEMDSSYVVDSDFDELYEPAVVNLEHQSTPVDEEKIKIIGNYNIQQIADERLPPFNVIATHIDKEKSVQKYKRTPTNTSELYFIDLGEKNIQQRLNTVSNIVRTNEKHLTIKDALNLGIIVLFAPRDNARNITRKVLDLYMQIKHMPEKLEFTLYSVISAMINAYFDDEKEYDELINMINYETEDEIIDKFETEIRTQNKMKEVEQFANDAIEENKQLKAKIKELEKKLESK